MVTLEESKVRGAWFTVPVPKLEILAEIVPLVPVELVIAPVVVIGKFDALVVKLCEEDAHTPFGSAELPARTR